MKTADWLHGICPHRLREITLRETLRAGLKKERGCVEDQPQHGENSTARRKVEACCGWSRTTQPRSGIYQTGS
jgi:hypothetical protein